MRNALYSILAWSVVVASVATITLGMYLFATSGKLTTSDCSFVLLVLLVLGAMFPTKK